jgi:hypothetical protein
VGAHWPLHSDLAAGQQSPSGRGYTCCYFIQPVIDNIVASCLVSNFPLCDRSMETPDVVKSVRSGLVGMGAVRVIDPLARRTPHRLQIAELESGALRAPPRRYHFAVGWWIISRRVGLDQGGEARRLSRRAVVKVVPVP